MLTLLHVSAITAFVNSSEEHVYGHCTVYKDNREIMGTAPINSAGEGSLDYFIGGSNGHTTICGYPFDSVGQIQLTKGTDSLILKDNKIK